MKSMWLKLISKSTKNKLILGLRQLETCRDLWKRSKVFKNLSPKKVRTCPSSRSIWLARGKEDDKILYIDCLIWYERTKKKVKHTSSIFLLNGKMASRNKIYHSITFFWVHQINSIFNFRFNELLVGFRSSHKFFINLCGFFGHFRYISFISLWEINCCFQIIHMIIRIMLINF